jgi:hypothetical protein
MEPRKLLAAIQNILSERAPREESQPQCYATLYNEKDPVCKKCDFYEECGEKSQKADDSKLARIKTLLNEGVQTFELIEDAEERIKKGMELDGSKSIEEYVERGLSWYTTMLVDQCKNGFVFKALSPGGEEYLVDVVDDSKVLVEKS